MRRAVFTSGLTAALCGCAGFSLTNVPTQTLVEQQLAKPKKLVSFSSALAPQELEQAALSSNCGNDTRKITTIAPTGTGLVGMSGQVNYRLEHGAWPDGARWLSIRFDSPGHGSPIGYRLRPSSSGGSDVTVYAADVRKLKDIQRLVEEGHFFCEWRKYSYPYD